MDEAQAAQGGATRRRDVWPGILLWVGLCFAAEILAGIFTQASVGTWFPGLKKPGWMPPPSLFAPVWTTLYVAMGIAAGLLWARRSEPGAGTAIALFAVQLAINAAWSGLFFTLRSPALGMAAMTVLWVLVGLTVIAFLRVHRGAGLLLVPYFLWLCVAAALNYSIWRLNP